MPPTSPTSPTSVLSQSPRSRQIPVGFLPSNKSKAKPIEQLSPRELHDLWNKNKKILAEPAPSTSTYHTRIIAEQAAIEATLGMASLENGLIKTHISRDETMDVAASFDSPSRTVEAKRRAIGRYHANTNQRGSTAALGLDEAMQIEQRAHAIALERKQQALERRAERNLPQGGEMMTREEREARIWAYMTAKPTESDDEDEEWDPEDEDEEDPSAWFEDEEDDGRKGQPLVDLDDIIRVDDDRWG